jgi:hypothetical protein
MGVHFPDNAGYFDADETRSKHLLRFQKKFDRVGA